MRQPTSPSRNVPSPPSHGAHAAKAFNVGTVPTPWRDPTFNLEEIIGDDAAQVVALSELRFHATGDTGRVPGREPEVVAIAMAQDFAGQDESQHPAFFVHLGDVLYGAHKETNYADGFYSNYEPYPGKIIAVPGNHDGEIKGSTDPVSLSAYWKNFCDRTPRVPNSSGQKGIHRETMNMPGVYWRLKAPFANIIGLYSNWDENFGYLQGKSAQEGQDYDTQQLDWLAKVLADIKAEAENKALIFVTHHPPFSKGGHAGSAQMVSDIDKRCDDAGLHPQVFISGHAHNYQRYTRTRDNGQLTKYIVCGTGGYGIQATPAAQNEVVDGVRYESAQDHFYGYLYVTVNATEITIQMRALTENHTMTTLDHISIPLGA